MYQSQREDKRRVLGESICSLSYSKLLEWGITRVADVTGLDTISLPVFTSVRPSGRVISISAGKGLNRLDAKTGAILESCELWAAENHDNNSWHHCNSIDIKSISNSLPFDLFPLCRDSILKDSHAIPWDVCHDIFRNCDICVPSDLIWLTPRVKPLFHNFQTSTNGIASGVTEQDALLQAVYELVERDGWSLADYVQERLGKWPNRISMDCELPDSIQHCLVSILRSQTAPYIFDLTTDFGIPVFGCHLLDLRDNPVGLFAGFGCSLDPETALRRAITEAAQGRCAYISGARDDLFRRKFLLMKNNRNDVLHKLYESFPVLRCFNEYHGQKFYSIDEEWKMLSSILQGHGISELYSKILYTHFDPDFVIARVVAPTLSPPMWEQWTPNKRASDWVLECLKT